MLLKIYLIVTIIIIISYMIWEAYIEKKYPESKVSGKTNLNFHICGGIAIAATLANMFFGIVSEIYHIVLILNALNILIVLVTFIKTINYTKKIIMYNELIKLLEQLNDEKELK